MMKGIWYMAGMVKPTTTLVAAQVQKLFDIDVKNPPVIKVARHVKKDNLLPILRHVTETTNQSVPTFQNYCSLPVV